MKLYSLSRHDRAYNEADMYQAIPCVRFPVVPGQSGEIAVDAKFQTSAFTRNLLSDALASVYLFYVPYRLVWTGWVDYITQESAPGAVPLVTTAMPVVFDKDVGGSAFYKRAYKLTCNEYFGDDAFVNMTAQETAWYSDITDETNVRVCRVKNAEQTSGRLVASADLQTPTYDATTVPIDLNDFRRAMANAISQRKANMSGDKYIDAMRRCGVELDWRVQNAPEFLGTGSVEVRPTKTFNTGATGLGDSVGRYEGTVRMKTGRKRFSEHGCIVGIFTLRAQIDNNFFSVPPDGRITNTQNFFMGDNYGGQDFLTGVSTAGGNLYQSRHAVYRNGSNLQGVGSTWNLPYTPAANSAVVYPETSILPISDELGTNDVAVHCHSHFVGQSPVPQSAL